MIITMYSVVTLLFYTLPYFYLIILNHLYKSVKLVFGAWYYKLFSFILLCNVMLIFNNSYYFIIVNLTFWASLYKIQLLHSSKKNATYKEINVCSHRHLRFILLAQKISFVKYFLAATGVDSGKNLLIQLTNSYCGPSSQK